MNIYSIEDRLSLLNAQDLLSLLTFVIVNIFKK